MAELKTKQTGASVDDFLGSIADEQRRKDCRTVASIMKQVTKEEPRMWGSSMVGFGSYKYKYDSGTKGEYFVTGFSPRKQSLTVYCMGGLSHPDLMRKLGKHKTGVSCLYIQKLDDIDVDVLKELIQRSVADVKKVRS